jgi:hypothetical protein
MYCEANETRIISIEDKNVEIKDDKGNFLVVKGKLNQQFRPENNFINKTFFSKGWSTKTAVTFTVMQPCTFIRATNATITFRLRG